jgi:hypothetical protein
MAAMTNLLVKDDAASPTELTFVAITDTPNPFWRAAIAGVPFEGQPRLYLSEELLKSGDYKRQMKLEVPVMETLGVSGSSAGYVAPPKVAYVEQFFATHMSNRRSTDSDRANLLKMAVGLLQGATSTTATGTLSQASAGSAFNSSSAPVPLFFVDGIKPN